MVLAGSQLHRLSFPKLCPHWQVTFCTETADFVSIFFKAKLGTPIELATFWLAAIVAGMIFNLEF
jgi:hypothetical protein